MNKSGWEKTGSAYFMKVLLISANNEIVPYTVYPIGLDYVAGSISFKHIVKIIDVNCTGIQESFIKGVLDFLPHIIGISIRNVDTTDIITPSGYSQSYIDRYKKIIDLIRDKCNAPIILGGSGFTIFPHELMELLGADYGIIGEGERLSEFLEKFESDEDVNAIPGVISKGKKGIIPNP